VSAVAIIGEEQRARDLMERLLRVASPLGLVAEEFDVDTGRHSATFRRPFPTSRSSRPRPDHRR
jgi:alpha,alpha-trehalase